jgi:hypothetical protein
MNTFIKMDPKDIKFLNSLGLIKIVTNIFKLWLQKAKIKIMTHTLLIREASPLILMESIKIIQT